jgi:hypothetical protein
MSLAETPANVALHPAVIVRLMLAGALDKQQRDACDDLLVFEHVCTPWSGRHQLTVQFLLKIRRGSRVQRGTDEVMEAARGGSTYCTSS